MRFLAYLFTFLFIPQAIPCTAFLMDKNDLNLVGKSYDWKFSHGQILVNKKNVQKKSLQLKKIEKPITWTSQHGSVTFNQYGREFPLGGINEKGLVIEVLWLEESEYPKLPTKQANLNELQWIQYHLDLADDTNELIQLAKSIQVSPVMAKVHYFACDINKNCALFEYLKGKLFIHSNVNNNKNKLPFNTLTNNNYFHALDYIKNFKDFGGEREIPQSYRSLNRFVRTSHMIQNYQQYNKGANLTYAFKILNSVASKNDYSKWNIVYNLKNKNIFYKTRYQNKKRRHIDIKDFNYSCKKPVMALDINNYYKGDVTKRFKKFSQRKNIQMVKKSLKEKSAAFKKTVYNYHKTTKCLE